MVDILSFAKSFLIWPACLGIIIGAAFLQLWLSSKKSPWPGLLPLAVLCIACLSITVWMFYAEAHYTAELLTCNLEGNRTAEAEICFDEKGNILGVSDISIKDSGGEQLDSVGWGEFRLKDVQKKVAGEYELNSDAPPEFDLEEHMVHINGGYYSRTYYLWIFVELGIPLLGVYLFKRMQLRRAKRDREFEKIRLQELQ